MSTLAEMNALAEHDKKYPSIDGDPRFRDLASGDVHLTRDSPCVDAASVPDAPAVDMDGLSLAPLIGPPPDAAVLALRGRHRSNGG